MLQKRIRAARRLVRRALQVVAFIGTLLVGIVALALIASQTPWFRDGLRRVVVREAAKYVNAAVSIGSLGGNLFDGVQLGDLTIDVDGEQVIRLQRVDITYSLAELLSKGVIRQVVLERPYVRLRHDRAGWNVATLITHRQPETDRQGPGNPLSLPDIEIVDGRVAIDDRAPSPWHTLPSTIDALNAKGGFAYAPDHTGVTLDRFTLNAHTPDLAVRALSGRIGTHGDDLHVERLLLQTPQSSVTVDGVVRNYRTAPSLQLVLSAPRLSLPEFADVVPALRGYDLHPTLDVKATGRENDLRLAFSVTSEAGAARGALTTDAKAPDLNAGGTVAVEALNLAPIARDPAQRSDITGKARFDLRLAGTPTPPAALDRLSGHVAFEGPTVVAAGHAASNVTAVAEIEGRHVSLDAHANAYGVAATAKGSLTIAGPTGTPLLVDLAGRASHVNLAALSKTINVPRTTTDLNASAYRVTGSFGRTTTIAADATLERSTLAGGTILGGTRARFAMTSGPGRGGLQSLSYAARGKVRDLNVHKVGDALQIAALAAPEYDSRINATFDVKGGGPAGDRLQLDATATATDSELFGGRLPRMAVEAHLSDGALTGGASGEFRGFDPARIANNPRYQGQVNGNVTATFRLTDVSAPVTADAISAEGRVTIAESEVDGFRIDSADVEGRYDNRRGNVRQATVKGPVLDFTASGPIALDEAGPTNLKYHVAANDLGNLGKLVGEPALAGSAVIDGTVSGNATALRVAGTLDGSNVGYRNDKALDLNSTYTLTVPSLQFASATVQAKTTGTFIQAAGLQIQTLVANTTYADRALTFQTQVAEAPSTGNGKTPRELDASGSVVFHPDHREILLPLLALRTQGVEWKTPPGSQAAFEYGSDRVTVDDFRLVSGDQSLAVSGSFALGDSPPAGGLSVHATNVELAQLDKLVMLNRGLSGRLDADATISGDAKAPDMKGHVDVRNGGFQLFKYQSLTADGSLANDRITIDARLVQSPGAELIATGTIPVRAVNATPAPGQAHVQTAPGQGIDLRVHTSRIDLGIVQGLTTQVTKVSGTVQADVTVSGTLADPHLNGYVDFQSGAFSIPQANTRFTGMTTRIEMQPDRIRVPRFQILDQHGNPLTIQGELAVHEGQAGAVDVAIDSKDFKIFDNQFGNVHLQTHLKLTGEVRRPRIEGELRTDAARLEVDRILLQSGSSYSEQALPNVVSAEDSDVLSKGADEATRAALEKGRQVEAEKTPPNATGPETAQTGIFSALALNVHVVAPDNLVVRGDDIRPRGPNTMAIGSTNATIGADVQIVKKVDGAVTIRGAANTIRGFYEFQGRRFTLKRGGTARFDGGTEMDPRLDVTAERLIPNSGVTARIHITGTARAPKLTLTSDPPLDEADILSLIVFNRNINDLGAGEKASLTEVASGIASGFVAQALGKSIGKALDVDLFEITTTDPETGEAAGGLTLGKQVSDRAFVQFRQQFGNRSFTEFMLEYQLAKFLRLDVRTAPQSNGVANRLTQSRVERAGVDVIFFFSY